MNKGEITFSSSLGQSYREALEDLLFFNPQQGRMVQDILHSIESFGGPRITVSGDRLSVTLDSPVKVQVLYALDRMDEEERLAGVVIYTRSEEDAISVLHIAVNEEYSVPGVFSDRLLVVRIINELRRIGGHVKGIRWLRLFYRGGVAKIPVRH